MTSKASRPAHPLHGAVATGSSDHFVRAKHDRGGLIEEVDLAPGLSEESFRETFRHHPAGVAVVTADDGSGPVALTATSVFSVSATPPLLVFSVSALSSATPTILNSPSVVVHLLTSNELELAQLCATSGVDRFADLGSWSRLHTGEPYFVAPATRVRGTIAATYEAGTSTLVVVNATHAVHPPLHAGELQDDVDGPLVYHNRTWHQLGTPSRIPAR